MKYKICFYYKINILKNIIKIFIINKFIIKIKIFINVIYIIWNNKIINISKIIYWLLAILKYKKIYFILFCLSINYYINKNILLIKKIKNINFKKKYKKIYTKYILFFILNNIKNNKDNINNKNNLFIEFKNNNNYYFLIKIKSLNNINILINNYFLKKYFKYIIKYPYKTINITQNQDLFNKYKHYIKHKINIYNFPNIFVDFNQILNILIQAKKHQREEYEKQFQKIIMEKRKEDIVLEKIISFYDVKFGAGNHKGVIVITKNKPEANWINIEINNLNFRNTIFNYFGYKFIILAVSQIEWYKIKINYIKWQNNKLFFEFKNINVEEYYQNIFIKQIENFNINKNIIQNGQKIFYNIKIIK